MHDISLKTDFQNCRVNQHVMERYLTHSLGARPFRRFSLVCHCVPTSRYRKEDRDMALSCFFLTIFSDADICQILCAHLVL